MIKSNYLAFRLASHTDWIFNCPVSNAASLVLDYECSELGFNSCMLTVARSLNNPSYDHDLLNHIQHATPKIRFIFLAIQKFAMKCESCYDAEIAQLRSIVSLHAPFPGFQSSVSQFMKAEQSNLMILSIAEYLNIFCKVD